MDILTIVLSARKKELWLYYAFMATMGSVIGGYVTYRLARKGGKETIERKFSARTLVALTAGRIVRYSLLAFLTAHYGRQMLATVMSRLGHPVLMGIIGLIAAAIAAFIFILLRKRNRRAHT
jgi:membrane protein YqaA with SNARE-associated domain